MKILVVDDSKAMRMIIMRSLRATTAYHDAVLLQAEDGRQGLELVAAERPDLVLSDWNMPGLSGLEFLQALRAGGDAVAFGFVTSESTPEMYDRAIGAGAQFLLTKPFSHDGLASAVAAVRR